MVQELTPEQKLIISGFTQTLCCKFDLFHEDVEKRLNRPVFTHEFPSLVKEIQEVYRKDFMQLIGE